MRHLNLNEHWDKPSQKKSYLERKAQEEDAKREITTYQRGQGEASLPMPDAPNVDEEGSVRDLSS